MPCRKRKHASNVRSLGCAAPGTASKLAPEAHEGALCAAVHGDAESADANGPGGGPTSQTSRNSRL
eukprot:15475554-Alexandrium_andersonii.AAC.1